VREMEILSGRKNGKFEEGHEGDVETRE